MDCIVLVCADAMELPGSATLQDHVNLYELKTYHEVVDEIYYKVTHLEPWEKGSRRTSGQTGMCGGVRGVGAGGIVSTAYCLLYKLFTLKLTRKQLNGLITHCDSPYIRALGFMYIRYTQPPQNLLEWFESYLDDTEELDVKAGGGQTMKIGMMLRQWLVKLEWFSTLFPRIPVPIQQRINSQIQDRFPPIQHMPAVPNQEDRAARDWDRAPREIEGRARDWDRERETTKRDRDWGRDRERDRWEQRDRDRDRNWDRERDWDRERERERMKDRDRIRERSPHRDRTPHQDRNVHRERSPHRDRHYRSRDRDYYSSKETHRSSSKYKTEREKYRK